MREERGEERETCERSVRRASLVVLDALRVLLPDALLGPQQPAHPLPLCPRGGGRGGGSGGS